jgi:SAM-dependent methyltransferase
VSRFETLKADEAAAWSSAPWEQADWILAPIHLDLVAALEPKAGEEWLDLATGTGAVARLAARRGASVTGVDFAARSIETARMLAAVKGLAARFEVGDVEQLPYEDESFDVLSSSMGMIFAPDHEAVAREVARVCKRGGRLGFTAWKPGTGFTPVSEKYRPPAAQGAGDPDDWSREEYVRNLLEDAFELRFEERANRLPAKPAAELVELLTNAIGPIKALAGSLEPSERERFVQELTDYIDGFGEEGVPGDYVLVLGRRR